MSVTLDDFISNLVSDLTEKLQIITEKLLINDIIMIYNERYTCYEDYIDEITKANKRNDEFEKLGISFAIYPKHTIICKETYNFIKDLREVYK